MFFLIVYQNYIISSNGINIFLKLYRLKFIDEWFVNIYRRTGKFIIEPID